MIVSILKHLKRDSFKNRNDLVEVISSVDYILSESYRDRHITVNDLFLEKSEDLGMKCVSLLLKQVRYQYHLLRHIPHNGDFQTLLDEYEFNMDVACLKYILSTEVTNHDLRMTETQMSLHITCDKTKTPFKPIKCQSLVNFTDKFLQLIITKLQNHQEDCKVDNCVRCTS